MERRKNADTLLPRQLFRLRQDQLLVGNVQIAGRLVEYHELRLLGHSPGNGDFLPFAAGQLVHIPAGKFLQAHIGNDLLHRHIIVMAGFQAEVRHPTHEDGVKHTQRTKLDILGHIGDPPRPLPPGHFQKILPVKGNRAAFRGVDAKDILK